MSRIGKKPVPVGAAKVNIAGQLIKVEGSKGKLELNVHPACAVAMDGDKKNMVVTRKDDERQSRALHGLTRALLANMVEGVTKGYSKGLEIQGVGYKAEIKGKILVLSVGYANQIELDIPGNLTVTLDGTNKVNVAGADKQAVGEFAARIRRVRKPEPYKGKGIRYEGEKIKIKAGKAFAGAGAAK
jgi:large subunit ribosomal protein L6